MAGNLPRIGFIGLGAMGRPMTANLLEAGYSVLAYDINPARLEEARVAGASAAAHIAEVVAGADVVLTCLPSSESFVEVAQRHLLPGARAGQVFIDVGTTTPPETRRLAGEFAARGAVLMDAPVSGGPQGVQNRALRIFAAGPRDVFERIRPVLEALGGPHFITWCGESGCGQVVKGVNQLMMALAQAAYIEAVAFGLRAGVDAAILASAVGGEGWLRKDFLGVARRIAAGEGEHLGVKFRELPYFLREAREKGFRLPLTETLFAFCDAGQRIVIDDNRPAPSFFHELMIAGVRCDTPR